uniref:Uncharacterized protein n=1 Tax=Heliothis virescens TaxID=7102 RepID=A0A2A4JJK4_HELVI
MDPVIDSEWLGCKNEPIDEMQNVGNISRSWQWRERGINPPNYPNNKTVLENMAEDILVQKPLQIRSCDLPGYPRSTFLMVFSPDGTKVASTHGNHNVYVSELASGRHVRILRGHPRTPWCIAFHPSHPLLIGSGCLGGQVRVWDIASGGSEVWNVRNETVIASIAFHPREQLLVIATYNELYFWDWSQPAPFTRVSTNNVNEKVRYVAFDALGYKLITGISLWACSGGPANNSSQQQNPPAGPPNNPSNNNPRRDDPDDSPGGSRPQESPGSAQDMIVNSYQNLVQRYDSLVRNYQRLFMVRHRLTSTPPPPNTTDRGTDPMETDTSPTIPASWTRPSRTATTSAAPNDATENPTPSTSRTQDPVDTGDGESSSRLLNLDVLSIDGNPTRNPTSNQERSQFGSRSSAFQPLNGTDRSYRTIEYESTRLLPNPFSSAIGTPRPARITYTEIIPSSSTNTSRTSIFTSSRGSSLGRDFSLRRRNFSPLQTNNDTARNDPGSPATNPTPLTFTRRSFQADARSASTESQPSTSVTAPVDAQTINESLDLIRDILRDSGTRLLNLITNMSLSTLACVRSSPRRGARAQSDDSEGGGRPRGRWRLCNSTLRRDFLSSSSDSDSDQSSEVNIFRTRNTTFREDESRLTDRPTASTSSAERLPHPTDRLVFELNEEARNGSSSREPGPSRESRGINVSLSNNRFRVRTQSDSMSTDIGSMSSAAGTTPSATEESPSQTAGAATPSAADGPAVAEGPTPANEPETSGQRTQGTSDFNPDRPSTSRDDFWNRGGIVPPEEAYRKVRSGVNALQKHTVQLTNLWLRGNRTTMRELRGMWENLRRRILMLHRETGRQDVPSYYTRPLLDRCMMLTDMTDSFTRTARNLRNNARNEDNDRRSAANRNGTDNANNANTNLNQGETSTSNDNASTSRQAQGARSSHARTSPSARSSPSLRRRLQSNYRWRPEDELRRRSRNPTANRLAPRYTNRSRRDFMRAIEISATRHEIRMRAMQVLSVMFNMMMMCLEERGLSQLIINMLRTLKRALALTCLIVMSNRNNGRTAATQAPTPQRVESLDVVRIQNVEHNVDVNVDGPDEQAAPTNNPQRSAGGDTNQLQQNSNSNDNKTEKVDKPSTSKAETTENSNRRSQEERPSTSHNRVSQRWSNRLAVQIAAANRNYSATARNRRDLYMESRRLKALHRTNPTAHPLIKKRAVPPVSNYRIPALRSLPVRPGTTRFRSPRVEIPQNNEPVAGPSHAPPGDNPNLQGSPGSELMNEFEHRVNFIRIAHMQAVRLRNAARNRFRRLQTIRLYTPSSVREMFSLQGSGAEGAEARGAEARGAGGEARHPLAMFRPHILSARAEPPAREDLTHQFHTVLNNVAMPLMQMSDLPASNDAAHSHRLPRIHEYLQPIILAQNAMVVEEDGAAGEGGRRVAGMAGLLDAGIISEALPAPSHRVQAWDFTTGDTPDISDSTKNVVVQRCRIHNDASIDISKDGRLLVALLPVPRLRNTNHWLGVYSLEWARLGQCLHTAVLEQSAVSVALSPTARHLAVGLGSRRFTTAPHARNNVIALLYRLDPLESSSRTGLSPIKELEQNWEHGFTSLNCLRWAPQPGQGLVYANNTGQLIIMS